MICGSRARRVSKPVAILVWCLVLVGVAAAQAPWPPPLAVPSGAAAEVVADAAADRRWLSTQPAWRLIGPAPADTNAVLAWLQRQEQSGQADRDTAVVHGRRPARGHRSLLAELRDRWLARGYLDARIDHRTGEGRGIIVTPGPLYRLAELEVSGDEFPERQRLLDAWLPREGDVFRPEAYREQAQGLVADCAELGFPFPTWLTQGVVRDSTAATVSVRAILLPGPRAVVGPQSASLPPGRASRFVIRAAGVRSGQVFREADLQRGVQRLLARDLYVRVDEPLVHLTTARDTVGIRWRVEPRPQRNRVAVVLGLSRKAEGGTRLSGQVELDFPDLAGTGRRLAAHWNDDGDDRARFGFSYLEPLIMGTPLDTDVALESEVLTDQYNRFRLDNRWRMSVVALWGVEVGLGWDRSTYPEGDVERTSRSRARVAVLHNRGDRSRNGWSALLAVETANHSTSLRPSEGEGDLVSSELGRESTQRLLEGDLAGEFWLSSTTSVAARASFRQIDTEELPVALPEQYRFGGATTVRGYRENEFRGETAAWGGVELRLGAVRRSRVYTFVDVGYFEFTVQDPETDALSRRDGSNVGFGLGLRTRAAPGRIDLAVGFPGDVTFDTAKLHVSLVGAF